MQAYNSSKCIRSAANVRLTEIPSLYGLVVCEHGENVIHLPFSYAVALKGGRIGDNIKAQVMQADNGDIFSSR